MQYSPTKYHSLILIHTYTHCYTQCTMLTAQCTLNTEHCTLSPTMYHSLILHNAHLYTLLYTIQETLYKHYSQYSYITKQVSLFCMIPNMQCNWSGVYHWQVPQPTCYFQKQVSRATRVGCNYIIGRDQSGQIGFIISSLPSNPP